MLAFQVSKVDMKNSGCVGQLVVQEALNLPSERNLWVRTPPHPPLKELKMSSCKIRDIPEEGYGGLPEQIPGGISTDTLIEGWL